MAFGYMMFAIIMGGDITDNENWEGKVNWEIPIYWSYINTPQ